MDWQSGLLVHVPKTVTALHSLAAVLAAAGGGGGAAAAAAAAAGGSIWALQARCLQWCAT
jgi:hypothetical protein